jgi:hypothetical protein
MMPNIPLPKGILKTRPDNRPKTAPALDQRLTYDTICRSIRLPANHRQLTPRKKIPKLSEADKKCPYDPCTYHSFLSIEECGCDICCGIRSFAGSTLDMPASSEPCKYCRSRSPFSHIASSFERSRGQSRSSSAARKRLAQLFESSSSSDKGPRIVPAAVAATRIGNPPRRALCPSGLITLHNTIRMSSTHEIGTQQRVQPRRPSSEASRESQTLFNHKTRPMSPKLHHLHGLPSAKDYPYVHRREVDAHIAALRTGSPSPLRYRIDEVRHGTQCAGTTDYSRTVFYGHTKCSSFKNHLHKNRTVSPSAPHSGTTVRQRKEARGSIIVDKRQRGGIPIPLDLELESSSVYQRRSPQESTQQAHPRRRRRDDDSDKTFSTLTTQTPSTIGGKRLELKGGSLYPQLRGGGESRSVSLGFKLKEWLLTCRTPCRSRHAYDEDSDADLPPARTLAPERIAKPVQRACGGVSLPKNVSRGSVVTSRGSTSLTYKPSTCNTCSPTLSRESYRSLHFPPLRSSSPIKPSRSISPPFPSLRGGAGSASRLPPTLYWLAGGRGKPITVSSWKSQRGKKRMGGLLGMAVFGKKAGTLYEKQETGELAGPSLSLECRRSTSERAVHSEAEEAEADDTPGEVLGEENAQENARAE